MDVIRLFSGGFPLTIERIQFLQNAWTKGFIQISRIVGTGYRIIDGVELDDPDTPTTVTSGTIILNTGEIMAFSGGDYNSQVYVVEIIIEVPYNEDIDDNGELDLKTSDVYRYAQCGAALVPIDGEDTELSPDVPSFPFASLKRIPKIEQIAPVIGEIKMLFSDTIPDGWQICDGSNGTPDLRGRFPVGAGGVYSIGDFGGSNDVTLTLGQMPNHQHNGSITIPPHSHSLQGKNAITHNGEGGDGNRLTNDNNIGSSEITATSQNTAQVVSYNSNYKGNDEAHENRPPYRALNFIMFVGF